MSEKMTSIEDLIRKVKSRPDIHRAGMILCHNGIVRASDRSGSKQVRTLRVSPDRDKLKEIAAWGESQTGIIAVLIEAAEGELQIGDDLLYVVVAGDLREHVFETMRGVVDRVKADGVAKTETYA
jgi:molybdopterin synthase catalytic subunit